MRTPRSWRTRNGSRVSPPTSASCCWRSGAIKGGHWTDLQGNAEALKELEKRGGKLTVLQGNALEELKALDREKTEPELAKLMSPEIFAAAKRFVGRN
jgi:hypothetical protein